MNCKDCKDTGLYQPLIGLPEKCQTCNPYNVIPFTTHLNNLYIVGCRPNVEMPLYQSLLGMGLLQPILAVYEKYRRYRIVDGRNRFVCLCHMRRYAPTVYDRHFPRDEVTIETRLSDEL